MIRAVGPSLAPFGVTGLLADPRLEFFVNTTKSGSNDDWGGAATLSAAFAEVGAFPLTNSNSRDAALLLPSVSPGSRTVLVSGDGVANGNVLTELYDATPVSGASAMSPRLTNVSILKNVGAGLTAGFIIRGAGTKTVLIRAVGPSLTPFGVSGALADPKFELFDGQSRSLAVNDNWADAGTLVASELSGVFSQVGAFNLASAASKDAALLITLAPANYTVHVRSADATTGVALVEVYEVP